MGSHFWPLYTLVNYGIPNFSLRTWNPGNLGGEPHLLHYFPLPYLMIAGLSTFVPLGMAFNFGTVFPIIALPICVYVCLRGLSLRFPMPLLGAVGSLLFVYNESYSMWGGNTLSTLAGQFAHGYALCFFLIGTALLSRSLSGACSLGWSGVAFAAVSASHGYVALIVPFCYFVLVFFPVDPLACSFQERLRRGAVSAMYGVLLSLWCVVPMVSNAPWTTPYGTAVGRRCCSLSSKSFSREPLPSDSDHCGSCFSYGISSFKS